MLCLQTKACVKSVLQIALILYWFLKLVTKYPKKYSKKSTIESKQTKFWILCSKCDLAIKIKALDNSLKDVQHPGKMMPSYSFPLFWTV